MKSVYPAIIAGALITASLVYPIIVFTIFPNWVIDDAFITFRYAENLAKHGALTWNVGEKPIEGYTGVFLPVILAGFIRLGFDPINVSHAVGVLSFFAGWFMLFFSLKILQIHKLAACLVMLFYSTTPIFFTHALSGLETMLFVASIFLSIYCFLRFLYGYGRRSAMILFLSLLFTSLIRPEGVAFSAIVVLATAHFQHKHRRENFIAFLTAFICFYFLPAIIYFLWRWNYYGALLPNTFYAKRGTGFSLNIFVDIFRFLRRSLAAPLFAAILLIAPEIDWLRGKIKNGASDFWDSRILYIFGSSAIFALILILFLSHSHLMTNFSARFYIPFLPPALLLIAYLFNAGFWAMERVENERPLAYKLALVLFVTMSLYQVVFQIYKTKKEEIVFASEEKFAKESQHYLAGEFLQKNLLPSEWLVVYLDAGAVPYFSKMKTLDFGALNDPLLARGNLSFKERVDYFYSKNPAAIFITSTSLDKVEYTEESDAITSDPRFQNYVLAKKYPSPLNRLVNWNELLFLRKDLLRAI